MQVIIFDFDYTLFDTCKFKRDLARSLEELNVTSSLFIETYRETVTRNKSSYDYDIDYQLGLIKQRITGLDIKLAKERLSSVIAQASNYLYSETEEILSDLEKDFKLVLLTIGNPKFQMTKAVKSGVVRYFEEVYFTLDHKSKLLSALILLNNERLYFITDSLSEFYSVNSLNGNIYPIIKIRTDKNYTRLPKDIKKIQNLKELKQIIREIK